jgi:HlyD family secretion protein
VTNLHAISGDSADDGVSTGVRMRDTAGQDRPVTVDRRRRIIVPVVAVLLAVLAVAIATPAAKRWFGSERSVAAERLRTAVVERGPFIRDVSVQGEIVAAVSPTVFAPAEGTVTLAARPGDQVTEGQRVASVDSPELNNRLAQERATLAGLEEELGREEIRARKAQAAARQAADLARVEIVAAERELRRAQRSWEYQVISQQDLEKARDDLEAARVRYRHASEDAELVTDTAGFEVRTRALARDRQQLLVNELERQVAALDIGSPVTGVIGDLAVEQKASVQRNQPLFTVVDLTALEVDLAVPEAYADDLIPGMPVTIRYGSETYPGVLASVSPEIRDNQVVARARFAQGTPAGLRQRQRVSATVVLENRPDALSVRRGPFLDNSAGRSVWVIEDGLARKREVTLGSVSIERVEITSGVSEGDVVVISGTRAFDDVDVVMITD